MNRCLSSQALVSNCVHVLVNIVCNIVLYQQKLEFIPSILPQVQQPCRGVPSVCSPGGNMWRIVPVFISAQHSSLWSVSTIICVQHEMVSCKEQKNKTTSNWDPHILHTLFLQFKWLCWRSERKHCSPSSWHRPNVTKIDLTAAILCFDWTVMLCNSAATYAGCQGIPGDGNSRLSYCGHFLGFNYPILVFFFFTKSNKTNLIKRIQFMPHLKFVRT